mmetsp:Transcript_38181/g.120566  ORF Transcript_38181/g.120566 Transcript_38181/m.120566 type:complete len:158 (+) Transcript_38181:1135-1608(+)
MDPPMRKTPRRGWSSLAHSTRQKSSAMCPRLVKYPWAPLFVVVLAPAASLTQAAARAKLSCLPRSTQGGRVFSVDVYEAWLHGIIPEWFVTTPESTINLGDPVVFATFEAMVEFALVERRHSGAVRNYMDAVGAATASGAQAVVAALAGGPAPANGP